MMARRHPLCSRPTPRLRTGAATLELAFVLPAFLLVVFGVVEIGRGFMCSHLLTNAARAGCRVGILPSKNYSDITAAVDAAMKNQGINGYQTTVKINGTTVTGAAALASNDEIAVSVSVPVENISWLPFIRYLSGDITGQFTLARE